MSDEEIGRIEGHVGDVFVIACPDCGKVLLEVRTREGTPGRGLNVYLDCILDGASRIHPVTVKGDDGAVLAEWPEAIENGRPIAFNEDVFDKAFAKGGN